MKKCILFVACISMAALSSPSSAQQLKAERSNHQIRIKDTDNNKVWTITTVQGNRGIGFWENGSTGRFVVSQGGRVGIGTNSPNNELVISGMQPVLDIHDKSVNSVNAARIRLLEGATPGDEAGAYMHYNGDENRLFFGTIKNGVNTNTMVIDRSSNNVGIGTRNLDTGNYRLMVNGAIRAKEIVVETGWADYVFDDDYRLAPLSEVSAHIDKHGHLPGIPSARQIAAEGVPLGEMQSNELVSM